METCEGFRLSVDEAWVMGTWVGVDRLGLLVLDLGVAALALLGFVALAMIACRQPARRLLLARAAILGLAALVPLVGLGLVPRFDLVATIQTTGLLSDAFLGSSNSSAQASPPGPAPSTLLVSTEWIGRGLTLLYLGGVAAGLARLALGLFGLKWLTRGASDPSPEAFSCMSRFPSRTTGRASW